MKKKYIFPISLVLLVIVTWVAFGTENEETVDLFVSPEKGEFVVEVVTTGELRAKNSTEIKGPQGVRDFRINNIKIQRLVPEGTVVEEGDFVAELDRSQIMGALQDAQLELQQTQSQVTQAQLDSTLTLSQARDQLINLEYTLEEREIAVEQSKYESPAVQRQTQIDLDKAKRQLSQEKKNYRTKVMQAEAKIKEIEAELTKKQNELKKIRDLMQEFTVYAPDKGMVIYRRNWNGEKTTAGEDISAWNPIVAELPDFTTMESLTYVNEIDIQKVKTGQSVTVKLDAIQNKVLTGTVTDVANIGEQRPNSDSKVYEVVIEIAETDSLLRPAMTTSNNILVNKLEDVLFLPLEAIHAVDSTSFVFKQDGLGMVMQEVELGLMNDNSVVIHRGIAMDDRVYLTMPEDTSGVSRVYLQEEITAN